MFKISQKCANLFCWTAKWHRVQSLKQSALDEPAEKNKVKVNQLKKDNVDFQEIFEEREMLLEFFRIVQFKKSCWWPSIFIYQIVTLKSTKCVRVLYEWTRFDGIKYGQVQRKSSAPNDFWFNWNGLTPLTYNCWIKWTSAMGWPGQLNLY